MTARVYGIGDGPPASDPDEVQRWLAGHQQRVREHRAARRAAEAAKRAEAKRERVNAAQRARYAQRKADAAACECSLPDALLAGDGRVSSKLRRAIERADAHLPDALDWYDPAYMQVDFRIMKAGR